MNPGTSSAREIGSDTHLLRASTTDTTRQALEWNTLQGKRKVRTPEKRP